MSDFELSLEADPPTAREGLIGRIPLLRMARPSEIAAAILFLVCDASYATGAVLALDGGSTVLTRLSGDVKPQLDTGTGPDSASATGFPV